MADQAGGASTPSRQEQQQGLLDSARAEPGVAHALDAYATAVRNGALTALPSRRTVVSFATSANQTFLGRSHAGLG